jgi:serine/threonine-protein kinase
MDRRDPATRTAAPESSATPKPSRAEHARILGRYALYDEIASGGMATVHLARLIGPVGFSRTVAIKRLHPHLANEPEFVAMFLDEARLAARVQHPNVVPTLDVVTTDGEIFLVMEYVRGESLSRLLRADGEHARALPARLASAIAVGVLQGLHAAHEARGEQGEPLDIIHRDVSPQNILLGTDGVPRILDFGIAKATVRLQSTQEGQVKGKLAYMAPEQLRGKPLTRTVDVYAASVVLWEMLTGRRLFSGDNEGNLLEQVLLGVVHPPSRFASDLPTALDDIVVKGLSRDPHRRFADARVMALALEAATPLASASEMGAWVKERAKPRLDRRAELVARIESASGPEPSSPISDVRAKVDSTDNELTGADQTEVAGDLATTTRVDTTLTSTATDSRAPPRPSRVRRLAPAVILSAGAIFLAGVWATRPQRLEPSAAGPPSATESAPSSSSTSTLSASTSSTPDPAAMSPSSAPSGLELGPKASSSAFAPAGPRHPSRDAPPPARRDCNPPYTRDASGRVQWKLNCL